MGLKQFFEDTFGITNKKGVLLRAQQVAKLQLEADILTPRVEGKLVRVNAAYPFNGQTARGIRYEVANYPHSGEPPYLVVRCGFGMESERFAPEEVVVL